MKSLNQRLLAAILAGGLLGVAPATQAGFPSLPPQAQRLDGEKYNNMHEALGHLRYAKAQLLAAGGDFKAHAAEIVAYVDTGITEIETTLKEQKDDTVVPEDGPPKANDSETQHMAVHHALDRLTEARVNLESAIEGYGGHRAKALDATDYAIQLTLEHLHAAEKKK